MQSGGVEGMEQFHEVVNIHGPGSLLLETCVREDRVNQLFDAEPLGDLQPLDGRVDLVVLLEEEEDRGLVEPGAQRLVLPDEADPGQPVPLLKVDRRRRVPRLDPNHRRFNLRRRPEVVFTNLEMKYS